MQKLEARPHNTQTTGLPNFQSRRRLAKSCVKKKEEPRIQCNGLKNPTIFFGYKNKHSPSRRL